MIDADTVYSSTADGHVSYSNATFSTCHDNTTGTKNDTNAASSLSCFYLMSNYSIIRVFRYYNLLNLSGTATDAAVYDYFFNKSGTIEECCVQQGTQSDTLVNDDYNNFSGSYWGKITSTDGQYNAISFNSSGLTAVNSSIGVSVLKTCLRNYTGDYLNSPPAGMNTIAVYNSEDTNGSRDPYLLS